VERPEDEPAGDASLRVLIATINYLPEQTGFGPHIAALAEFLASRGHAVTVLTGFPFSPHWRRWPEYRGRLVSREMLNGVEVIRATHYVPRRPGRLLARAWMEASFCVTAGLSSLRSRQKPWDVVLYCGAQPSVAMLARILASWKHIPYVVSIQDLAAQAATDVGLVPPGRVARLLERFEYAAYRRAGAAFVLSDTFGAALRAHGYPGDCIHLLRSPIDVDRIRPVPPTPAFRAAHGLAPDDFVVLYAGSMGLKQGLMNVVAAARDLATRAPTIKWLLVGDGEARPMIAGAIAQDGLDTKVVLLPLQSESEMAAMFAAADVLLLNQVGTVKTTVVPSKLLTYMAAGKPVVAAVSADSQGAAILRQADGGILTSPDDPGALAAAVLAMRDRDASARADMGKRNRTLAEDQFDGRKIVRAQEAVLKAVVAARR
jgi:colanic acid biosynthesis glycosyl transferase WcaI